MITWTPAATGSYAFTLRLDNDVGSVEQSFVLELVDEGSGGSEAGGEGTGSASTSDGASQTTEGADTTASSAGETGLPGAVPAGDPSGCGYAARGRAPVWSAWLFVLAALRRRRMGAL